MVSDSETLAKKFVERNVEALRSLDGNELSQLVKVVDDARQRRARVFLVGNGGSAATASHMATDLRRSARNGEGLRVMATCLSDCVPALTAIANDQSFTEVFSEQLEVLGTPGDVLIALSGSGRSPNIVRVLEQARSMGMQTVGLLGMGGGPAKNHCDVAVVVSSDDYQVIETTHVAVGHLLSTCLRDIGESSA